MDEQSVLVVGPAGALQNCLLAYLRIRGYPYVIATSADEALKLAHRNFKVTLVDLDVPGDGGDDLVQRLKLQPGDPGAVIGLTSNGHGGNGLAVSAIDVILHAPVEYPDLDKAIADALAGRSAQDNDSGSMSAQIRQEIDLWRSKKMLEVREIITEAAGVDVTVLITGETGTGKDVVARAIHHLSTRRSGPFVKVNCAAVPRELLESELFGHERGAFTGAHKLKVGKFESAHHGTIFLDEIGDLHPSLQAKLLHVLQDGDFSRVGGKSTLRVDVRVIAATNQDLERAVMEGRFREDLFYRLNVIQISVPPLRERLEEIPGLVRYFVQRYSKLFRREGFSISRPVIDRLLQHRYRGNVRELENLIKRMIVLGDPLLTRVSSSGGEPVKPEGNGSGPALEVSLKEITRHASLAAERDAIRKVLDQTGWNRVRTAKALNISYRALLYKMKRVGLREEARSARPVMWNGGDRAEGFTV